MRYLLPFLLLGVTACHLPATMGTFPDQRGQQVGYGYGGDTGWSSEPLRAAVWLDEFTGRASFDLNRPAHVAVFAMRPLGGVEMIYPGWGGSDVRRAFSSGRHTVRTESRLYHLARNSSRYGNAYHSGQTYIILIASDRPLRLQPLLATGRIPWLDHPSITWNPFVATNHIAREIVPRQGGAEWTAAYHVVWPEADLRRYDGRIPYTTVRCPGGAVISIPVEVMRRGAWQCPAATPPDSPDRPTTPAKPRVQDSPPIRQALPRRPRPADWDGATPTRPTAGDDRRTAPPRPVKPARVSPPDGTPANPGVERPRPDPRTSRPVATPTRTPRPVAPARPTASPRPDASPRPTASPRPDASPPPSASPDRPKASPRPTVRRAPAARPAVKPAPKPAPKPKARPTTKTKTKTKSGGGGD